MMIYVWGLTDTLLSQVLLEYYVVIKIVFNSHWVCNEIGGIYFCIKMLRYWRRTESVHIIFFHCTQSNRWFGDFLVYWNGAPCVLKLYYQCLFSHKKVMRGKSFNCNRYGLHKKCLLFSWQLWLSSWGLIKLTSWSLPPPAMGVPYTYKSLVWSRFLFLCYICLEGFNTHSYVFLGS